MERLYGVRPSISGLDSGEARVSVRPSVGLLQDIWQIARRNPVATIGIAGFPVPDGIDPSASFDATRRVSDERPYWKALIRECKRAGLDVVQLDDPAVLAKAFGHYQEADRFSAQLQGYCQKNRLWMSRMAEHVDPLAQQLQEAQFVREFAGDYALIWERADAINRSLQGLHPTLAVVDALTACVIGDRSTTVNSPAMEACHPLSIRYEDVDLDQLDLDRFKNALRHKRGMVWRRFRAATQWQIAQDPKEEVAFSGSWEPYARNHGLFELVNVSTRPNGRISSLWIDGLGSGDVEGFINDRGADFERMYGEVVGDGEYMVPKVTRYKGAWEDGGILRGIWFNEFDEGRFVMQKGRFDPQQTNFK